jgi:hypothetical protein
MDVSRFDLSTIASLINGEPDIFNGAKNSHLVSLN